MAPWTPPHECTFKIASNMGPSKLSYYHMKKFAIMLALVSLVGSRLAAQVTLDLGLDQEEYLPGEPIVVAVKITNQSGQQIHLGTDPAWLTFTVESADGNVVTQLADVPVVGAFDLESSQMGTKKIDIAPYFTLVRPGRYNITATLRIKEWNFKLDSPKKMLDVITGAKLWSQDFGIPTSGGMPEMRRYTLEQASYLHTQMRLYMQLSDSAEMRIIKTAALGGTVSFSQPQAQVDRQSQLHVLWQSGAQSFDYCVINPDGKTVDHQIYDDFNTRPKLVVNDSGDVQVIGGIRRPKPGESSAINVPAIAAPVTSAPAASK